MIEKISISQADEDLIIATIDVIGENRNHLTSGPTVSFILRPNMTLMSEWSRENLPAKTPQCNRLVT